MKESQSIAHLISTPRHRMSFDTFTIGCLRLRSHVYLCTLPFPQIGKLGTSINCTFNVHTETSHKALQLPEGLHSSSQAGARPVIVDHRLSQASNVSEYQFRTVKAFAEAFQLPVVSYG